jgi:hypothetical protein
VKDSEAGPSVRQLEQRVLQALCQGTPQGSIRETALSLLRGYRWQDPLHQAIFEAVLVIPSESPAKLRLELPARLTRRGFPDFDLEIFFAPHGLSVDEAGQLMRKLARHQAPLPREIT